MMFLLRNTLLSLPQKMVNQMKEKRESSRQRKQHIPRSWGSMYKVLYKGAWVFMKLEE